MKTTLLLLAALALCLSGCSSLGSRLQSLQGFTAGTITEKRSDPFGGGSFSAQGITTDSVSGITTINSAQVQEVYPMGWAFSVAATGVVIVPGKQVSAAVK